MTNFESLLAKNVPPLAASGMTMMDLLLAINGAVVPPEGEEAYTLADVQQFAHNMARMAMALAAQQGPPKKSLFQ
jgi:hypothetical protein